MKMSEEGAVSRTIVTAGDANYVWGVLMLLGSMRRWGMKEKVIVGAYRWSDKWLDFLGSWPNVKILELPPEDRRCITVAKPGLMLASETDYVTWVDGDGIFRGNCSDLIYGEDDALYSRAYSEAEIATHLAARLPNTLSTWLRDVGDRKERREIPDVCANVIGISLSRHADFLRKWIEQMEKVLPDNVGIVCGRTSPYFQTDESVLNSLLSCWEKAPRITEKYRLNNINGSCYLHFAYNPKPWQALWTRYSLRFYDEVIGLIAWCAGNGCLPDFEPLPPTLRVEKHSYYKAIAGFAPYYCKLKKLRRKLGL